MTKNELFEGALIKNDGKPCIVKELLQDQLVVVHTATNEEKTVSYSEVEPIHLTLEFFSNLGCSIREHKDTDDSKVVWDDTRLDTKYVHQFQQLVKGA